jgi:hypothetical protein
MAKRKKNIFTPKNLVIGGLAVGFGTYVVATQVLAKAKTETEDIVTDLVKAGGEVAKKATSEAEDVMKRTGVQVGADGQKIIQRTLEDAQQRAARMETEGQMRTNAYRIYEIVKHASAKGYVLAGMIGELTAILDSSSYNEANRVAGLPTAARDDAEKLLYMIVREKSVGILFPWDIKVATLLEAAYKKRTISEPDFKTLEGIFDDIRFGPKSVPVSKQKLSDKTWGQLNTFITKGTIDGKRIRLEK